MAPRRLRIFDLILKGGHLPARGGNLTVGRVRNGLGLLPRSGNLTVSRVRNGLGLLPCSGDLAVSRFRSRFYLTVGRLVGRFDPGGSPI